MESIHTKQGLLEIIDGLPMAIAVIDKDRKVVLANKMTFRFVNKSEIQLIGYVGGEAFGCIHHKDDPRGCGFGDECLKCTLRETVAQTMADKSDHQMVETTMVFKNQGEMHLRISTRPLNIENEPVVLLALENITEAKKQEQVILENEKRLKESEARLSDAQSIAHLGHWDWNIESGELFWSDEIYRIFGLVPQEFGATYEAFLKYVHPDDRQQVLDSVNLAIEKDIPYRIDHKVLRPGGEIRWVHEQGRITRNSEGKPIRMLGTVQDITEQKHAEKVISENEKKYRMLFESSIDSLFLVDVETGKFIDCNDSTIRLHQIESRENFLGLTPDQLSPEFQPGGQSSKELAMEYLRKAHREGSAVFEWVHQRRDGTEFPVLVTLSAMKIGGRDLVLALNRDLTEIKNAMDALKRYERIIATTPDLISLIDKDYVYRLVNDAYLDTFNKKREEIENHSAVELLGKKFFKEQAEPNLLKAFAGETVIAEEKISNPGRGDQFYTVTYHPVKNKDGSIDFVSVGARDVTDLRSFSDRLSLATDAGMIGIWEWNIVADKLHWDDIMFRLYGIEPQDFTGSSDEWRSLLHPEDLERIEAKLQQSIERTEDFNAEFRIIRPDGQVRHIKVASKVNADSKGNASLITGVNLDITERREMEAELRTLATTDPLTGAQNRRYFMERAEEEFDRSRRYGHPMSIVAIDIDHFKKINDTYGHPAGDVVLKDIVRISKRLLRTSDIFGRIGGEEFSIMLPQTDISGGWEFTERLRKRVSESVVSTDSGHITYTISAGITMIQMEDNSLESLLKRADSALYSAKGNGRNRVEKG